MTKIRIDNVYLYFAALLFVISNIFLLPKAMYNHEALMNSLFVDQDQNPSK